MRLDVTPNDDQIRQLSAFLKKAVDDIEPPSDLLARLRAHLASAYTAPAPRVTRLHARRRTSAGLRALPAMKSVTKLHLSAAACNARDTRRLSKPIMSHASPTSCSRS